MIIGQYTQYRIGMSYLSIWLGCAGCVLLPKEAQRADRPDKNQAAAISRREVKGHARPLKAAKPRGPPSAKRQAARDMS